MWEKICEKRGKNGGNVKKGKRKEDGSWIKGNGC
jgi:hypothetical protein